MLGRSSREQRVGREMEQLESRIADTRASVAAHENGAAQAQQAKRAAADDPAGFASADEQLAGHRREQERNTIVLEQLEAELAGKRDELARAGFDAAYRAVEDAAKDAAKASGVVAAALASASEAADALRTRREALDAAFAVARERIPDGVEFELPADADEPAWPETCAQLVEVIGAGPRQPVAKRAEALRKGERERAASRESLIRQAVRDMREISPRAGGELGELRAQALARLPDDAARLEAESRAGAEYAQARERRERNLRERTNA